FLAALLLSAALSALTARRSACPSRHQRLKSSTDTVEVIAREVGYTSEYAFKPRLRAPPRQPARTLPPARARRGLSRVRFSSATTLERGRRGSRRDPRSSARPRP